MTTVVVLGGTGFLARRLVRRLAAEGREAPYPRQTQITSWSVSRCASLVSVGFSCRCGLWWPRSRRGYSSFCQARRSPPARLTFSRRTTWRVGPCRVSRNSISSQSRRGGCTDLYLRGAVRSIVSSRPSAVYRPSQVHVCAFRRARRSAATTPGARRPSSHANLVDAGERSFAAA
jgi:hypothetical protein